MLGAALHFLTARAPHIISNLAVAATPVDQSVQTVEGLRDHDPHYGFSPPVFALIFGIVSGVSLPLGAAAGIYLSPVSPHTCALMMAFGAGALLFAVTVELYGHALREVEAGRLGVLEMFVIIFGALVGAAFYLTTNQWLKDAFPEPEEEAASQREIERPSTLNSTRSLDAETEPVLKAAQDARREARKEHEAAVREREELKKEHDESAPLMAALQHQKTHQHDDEHKKATAKAMWAKLRGEKLVLPEAFANCDKNRPFWNQTGFLCTAGFLVSVALKTVFG